MTIFLELEEAFGLKTKKIMRNFYFIELSYYLNQKIKVEKTLLVLDKDKAEKIKNEWLKKQTLGQFGSIYETGNKIYACRFEKIEEIEVDPEVI